VAPYRLQASKKLQQLMLEKKSAINFLRPARAFRSFLRKKNLRVTKF